MNNAKYLLDRIEAVASSMAHDPLDPVESAIAYATIRILVSDLDALNEEEYEENEFIDDKLGDVEEHAMSLARLDNGGGYSLDQHYLWLTTATSTLKGRDCFDVEDDEGSNA